HFVAEFTGALDIDHCGVIWGRCLIIPSHTYARPFLTASMDFSYDESVSGAAVLIFRLALEHRLPSAQEYVKMTFFLRGGMRRCALIHDHHRIIRSQALGITVPKRMCQKKVNRIENLTKTRPLPV